MKILVCISHVPDTTSKINFIENDSKFDTNGVQFVKTYTGVTYKNIYKNIDLHYYEVNGQLKYDYLVAAGADYKQIVLEIEGAEKISINGKGELVLVTPLGKVLKI